MTNPVLKKAGQVPISDFIRYHLRVALYAAVAELNGDEDLARRLHTETKLRLISMTDEELWELAKQTSFHKRVELVYKGYKQKIEELKTTPNEWMKDLMLERTLAE
ncbi:unnamed protein product [marine sediment metagenome]|uniref:Uncharacterized protein n=1 Tax=marine sediment metagenome TaxID=412755 RepID=X1I9Z4_9ZZZZ